LPEGFDPIAQIGGKLRMERCGQCQEARFAVSFA
jgi:hypothetical protein